MTDKTERARRTEWFLNDRFGMFIHWGLYAIPARGEWVRSQERISVEDYQPYFEQFNPTRYNPAEWAKLAKRAGMKCAVITTKHHDGFCLFDSKYTDYKATNTPAGRDLIREFVDAFRAEGIKIGFYYSLLDWHHPDFPAYGDRQHPERDNEAYKGKEHNFSAYIEYMHAQVRELLTNYGKIDIMWYDFSYDDMTGEKWEGTKLVNMTRELQPGIIIDNRLGGDILAENPEVFAGDFFSPEQIIPEAEIYDTAGVRVPWEACITLNNHWGYASADKDYKSAEQVVHMLVECVSKGGNLLLNVGPDAMGEIPQESVEILKQVGEWMARNGDSIYGCGPSKLGKPQWGRYTQRGSRLYAHIYERGIGPMALPGLAKRIECIRLLCDGSEMRLSDAWMAERYGAKGSAFIEFASQKLPDDLDTVLEITLKD